MGRRQTPSAQSTTARAGSPAADLAGKSGLRVRPVRPVRALAGALLVVAAVVAALAVYGELGDRTEVLALSRTVLAGEQITLADLRVVSISSDDELPTIPASERAAVVGQYARVRLTSGALLVADGVQPTPLVNPERVLMSVEVPAGQVPVGLREQSRVVLVVIPRRVGGTGDAAAPLLVEATVVSVPRNLADVVGGTAGGSEMVSLSVEVPAGYVALVGSADEVSIGVLDPAASFPPLSAPVDSSEQPVDGLTSTSSSPTVAPTTVPASTVEPVTTLVLATTVPPSVSPATTGAAAPAGSVG